MSVDRTKLALAALGTIVAVMIAVQAPALIPALAFGLAVWVALAVFFDL